MRKKTQYVKGPPEWIGEIADSSKDVDLGAKKLDYRRHDVREYLVMCIKERQLHWFDLQADEELQPDDDGVYRMRSFPGLWIHGEALFAVDYPRLMKTLAEGIASPEYAAFVKRLAQFHAKRK